MPGPPVSQGRLELDLRVHHRERDWIRTDPTTRAVSSTDAMLTKEPPTESATVAECQVTVERMAAPMVEATSWPITAKLTRRTTAMTSCRVWSPTSAREMAGPNSAPPTKPEEAQDPDDETLPVMRMKHCPTNPASCWLSPTRPPSDYERASLLTLEDLWI